MSTHRNIARQLQVWIFIAGSAAAVAFAASRPTDLAADAPAPASPYDYQRVGDQRCLVHVDSDTIVARDDGTPECVAAELPMLPADGGQ